MLSGLKRLSRHISQRDAARREQINRRTREVLAEISHEMRQPLSAAAAALQMLRQATPDPASNQAWLVLERQIQRLSRLVDDLSEMSRSSVVATRLHVERLDLRHAVEEAVDAVQPAAAARHQRLDLTLPPLPVWVDADWARLQQVLANLLGNSIKYTPPRGSIRVRVAEDSGRAVLTVSDTGRGIRPDVLPRIFEPFATGGRAGAHGLGVGLAVARKFVELHGGSIAASSAGDGRGSQFVVTLPAGSRLAAPERHPPQISQLPRP